MNVPAGIVEGCASKDKTRPVLTRVYLRITGECDGARDGRKGWLEATDSYQLVRYPVELHADDVEGFVPVDALKAARKLPKGDHRFPNAMIVNGDCKLSNGQVFPRETDGQFPNTEQFMPAPSDDAFEFGISAEFLAKLAKGLGARKGNVRVRFVMGDDGKPNPLRPMTVRALGSDDPDAAGIIMPVRLP